MFQILVLFSWFLVVTFERSEARLDGSDSNLIMATKYTIGIAVATLRNK